MVSATGQDKVYDASTSATVILATDALGGDTVTASYTTANFAGKGVGIAKTVSVAGIAIAGADASNYTLQNTTASTTANIGARALVGSITADNKEYDETTTATIATRALVGVVAGDDVAYIGGTANFAIFHVGTGILVTATGLGLAGADAANYTVNSTATTTADIDLRNLTITPTATAKTYGDAVVFAGTEFTTMGLLGEDTVTSVTLQSAGAAANAHASLLPYAILASDAVGDGLDDYSINYADGPLTVTPRALVVSATGQDKVYDASTAATVILATDALSGDAVTASYTTANFAGKDVGIAKTVSVAGIAIAGADASNYSLQNITASTTADITPTGLTVNATGVDKTYDATHVASVSLSDNHLGSDNVTLSYVSATFSDKNVGIGKTIVVAGIEIGGGDAANYTLRDTSTTTTADIGTKALVGSITADNKEYDETTTATIATRTLVGVVEGDDVAYVGGIANFATFHVGTGILVTATGLGLAGADAANYTVNSTATTTADISLRTLTITPTATDKTYGNAVVFAGTEFTAVGLLGEDTVTSVTLESAGAAATATVGLSPYAIIASNAQGTGLEDYSIVYADGPLTVAPFTLTVTGVTASNKVYDATTSAVIDTTSAVLNGVIGSDAVVLDSTGSAGDFAEKNVGNDKPVAVSGLSLAGADADNYIVTQPTTTASIFAAVLVGSFTANDKEWDNTTAATIATRTLAGVFSADMVSYVGGIATFDSPSIGAGKLVTATGLGLAGTDATNYTVNSIATTTAEITALHVLTITANGASKSYGDAVVFGGTEFTAVGLVGEDTITSVTLVSAGAASTATVGLSPYSIVASNALGTGLEAYKIVYEAGELTVLAKVLTVSGVTAANKVYDATDTAVINTTSAALGGVVGSDVVSLDSNGKAGTFSDKNVGNGKLVTVSGLTLSGDDAGNYTLAQPTTSANISAAGLTVTGATAANKVYDANNVGLINATAAALGGVLGTDVVTLDTASATGSFADKIVGNAKLVTVSGLAIGGLDSGNYTIAQPTTTANITPAGLTVTAAGVNKSYDAMTEATVTLADNHLGTDIVTLSYTVAGFSDKNVGTGKPVFVSGIAIAGADAANYTLQDTSTPTTANITAKALVGSISADNKQYDGTTTAIIAARTLAGVVAGDVVSYIGGTANFATSHIGTGILVTATGLGLAGADAANYTVNSTATTTADIDLRNLTITPTATAKTYGDVVVFAGTEFTAVGLLGEDTVTSVTLESAGAAANAHALLLPYAIVASNARGTGLDDYTFTYADGTLTVAPRALVVSATGQDKVYDASSTATVILATDALGGDTVTASYTTATFAGKDVGIAKTVSVAGIAIAGADASNYTLQNNAASTTADIGAKALVGSITADNKQYDETTSATIATRSLVGVVAGDDVAYVGGIASFATFHVGTGILVTATGLSLAGADAANYTVNPTVTTNADIDLRNLTITPTATAKTYGNAVVFAGTEFTAVGLLGEDTVTSVTLESAGAAATARVGLSPYAIVASNAQGTGLDDYSIIYADGSLAVAPRALVVSATGQDKVYDASTAATVILATDALSGDTVTASYTTATFADKDVGIAKTVSVAGIAIAGADASNYTLQNSAASTTADVTPTGLTVNATGVNKTYDATTVASVILSDNHLGSDTVTLSYGSATFSDKNVGTGKTVLVAGIAIGGGDAANYTLRDTSTTTTADIGTKALVGSITADNKEYDETTTATIATRTVVGVVAGDEVAYVGGTANFATFHVGTGILVTATGLSLAGADAANYTVNSTAATTADIDLRNLTITPTATAKTYGNAVVFEGTEFTAVGLLGEDTVTSVTLDSPGAAVMARVGLSPYAIVASDAQGIGLDDYSIIYADGTLTVAPRELVVTATADNKVYDGLTEATVTLSNDHLSGDIVQVSYATSTFYDTNAATDKIITVDGLALSGSDAENYVLASTIILATANISTRPVTVTADAESKPFGFPDPPLTYQMTSGWLAPGDSFSGILTRAEGESVGVYPIEVGSLTLGSNYALSFVGADLTIVESTKGSIVTSSGQTYFGEDITFTATFTAPAVGSSPMTGSVSYYDGNTYLGTAQLVAIQSAMLSVTSPLQALLIFVSGQANLATSTLSVGGHVIKAVYSGDANYKPATSVTPATVDVIAATTTTTLSTASSAFGITLTAAVSVTSPGTPSLVGTMAFYDNGTLLGTVPVVNNLATLSIPPLSWGEHSLHAWFTGGGSFSSSTSTVDVTSDGPKVVGVTRYGARSGSNMLVLDFDSPLDRATAQDVRSYSIVGIGCNRVIPVRSALYDEATRTVTLTLGKNLLPCKAYRLTVYGRGRHVVTGSNGLPLDGAGTGKPSNFVTRLTKSTPWKPGKAPTHRTSVAKSPAHLAIVKQIPKPVVHFARTAVARILSRRIGK